MKSKMSERQFDLIVHGVRDMMWELAEHTPEVVSAYQLKSSVKDVKEAIIAEDVFLQRVDAMDVKESIVNDVINHLEAEGIELVFTHTGDPKPMELDPDDKRLNHDK